MQHIKDETKPEEMDKSNFLFYLRALIRWSQFDRNSTCYVNVNSLYFIVSVAIKFKNCGVDRCEFSPLDAWKYMSSVSIFFTVIYAFCFY